MILGLDVWFKGEPLIGRTVTLCGGSSNVKKVPHTKMVL